MGRHSKRKKGKGSPEGGQHRGQPKESSSDPKTCRHPGYTTKPHPTATGKLAKCPHCQTEWFISD